MLLRVDMICPMALYRARFIRDSGDDERKRDTRTVEIKIEAHAAMPAATAAMSRDGEWRLAPRRKTRTARYDREVHTRLSGSKD